MKQRGSALAISLIILFVLTLVGVTMISTSTLEERMAGNARDQQLAFQAAESALREAERIVRDTPFTETDFFTDVTCAGANCFSATCDNGLCFTGSYPSWGTCVQSTNAPVWQDTVLDVWGNSARHMTYSRSIAEALAVPKYLIEFICYKQKDPTNVAPTPIGNPAWQADWARMFRITVLATGGTLSSKVMLQSTYSKP